jgi:DNA invertase Pin-like site-specific DNA recombinase
MKVALYARVSTDRQAEPYSPTADNDPPRARGPPRDPAE